MRRVVIVSLSILLVVVFVFVCFGVVVFSQKKDLCINEKCAEYLSNLRNPILMGKFRVANDKSNLVSLHISGMEQRVFFIGMSRSGGVGEMNVQVIHNGEKMKCVLGADSVLHESPLFNAQIYYNVDCLFETTGDDYVHISYLCPKCENGDALTIESGMVPLLSPMIVDLKNYVVPSTLSRPAFAGQQNH